VRLAFVFVVVVAKVICIYVYTRIYFFMYGVILYTL